MTTIQYTHKTWLKMRLGLTEEHDHEEWSGHTKGIMFLPGTNGKNLSGTIITLMPVCRRREETIYGEMEGEN